MANKLTQEEAARRLKQHGAELLDVYQGCRKKILVRYIQCGHERTVTPSCVLEGYGCLICDCASRRITQSEAQKRFSDRGLEILGSYTGRHVKVKSRCIACGFEWLKFPQSVFSGGGCPKCTGVLKRTQAEMEEKFRERGLELLGEYKMRRIRVETRCLICCYEWAALPQDIVAGRGCPQCGSCGFRPGNPAILYYLRVFCPYGDPLYKIGITNRTVKERLRWDMDKVTVLGLKHFQIGADARQEEQRILREFSAHRYVGPTILEHTGNTELFTIDVLGLDGPHQTQWLELEAA
jgi:hypothetical protein